jgi:hypothetical protein
MEISLLIKQGFGVRPWYEVDKEANVALVSAFSFMNKGNCICSFGCFTRQIEG